MQPLRRLVAIPASIVLLLALSGSGTTARADPSADRPRVVLLNYPEATCQEHDLYCEPFQRAARTTGVSGQIRSLTQREDPVDALELLGRQGHDLVIAASVYPVELAKAAGRVPNGKFAIVDWSLGLVPGRPRNVQGVVFRTSEAAYLAGWLAASLEARRPGPDVLGVVGGVKAPPVLDYVIGFMAGARRASPSIRVLTGYSGDFMDGTKCAAIARRQIALGAGAVFDVAGVCGLGALAAAADSGVWGIAVDTDQTLLGPHILTSVLKNFDPAFLALFRQVKKGRIVTGRDNVLRLRDGAVGLGRISPRVPASIRKGVERLRRDIVAGRVQVPAATWTRG